MLEHTFQRQLYRSLAADLDARVRRWDRARADQDAEVAFSFQTCDTSEVRRYVVLLLALTVARSADKSRPKTFSRARAAAIIANARKIVSPNGIERLETVRIGGIEQWVSIRGYDKRNPVLLFIHGGPGYVSMPMSWWFSRGWEEYFTVVQWDQRGAGKTYFLNDPAKIAPTLTLNRMQADSEEMVNWIRQHLGKEKIFVIGHSWGSYLGLELAKNHPEWLHAYIGVGQLTNSPESERRGWVFAVNAARNAGNTKAVGELQAIAPYFAPGHPSPLKAIYTQRMWLDALRRCHGEPLQQFPGE